MKIGIALKGKLTVQFNLRDIPVTFDDITCCSGKFDLGLMKNMWILVRSLLLMYTLSKASRPTMAGDGTRIRAFSG